MSRQGAKFISSFCVAMALSDDAKKDNPKEKSQNLVKPSKLSIYEEPQDLYSYEYFGKEKSKFEEGISFTRKELQSAFEATSDARESIKSFYETGKSHSLTTADYVLDDANVPAKVGAITVGGLLGLLIGGRKKGFIKKLFYTTLGATGTAALVYPKEASQISRELYDNAGDYSLIAYNFVAGVKPQNETNQSQPSVPQEPQKTKTPPSEVSSHPHPQQDHRSFRSLLRQSSDVNIWGFRLFDRKDVSTLPSRPHEEPSLVSVKESLTSNNGNKFSESAYESSDSVIRNNNVMILRDTKNSREFQDVSSQNKSDAVTHTTKLNDSLDSVQQYNIDSDTFLDTSSESQVIKNKCVSNSLKAINTNSYNSSEVISNSNTSLLGSNSIIVDSNTSTNDFNSSINTNLRKCDSDVPVIKSKSHVVNDNLYVNMSAADSNLANGGFKSSAVSSNSSKDYSNPSTSTVSHNSSTVESNSPTADSNSSTAGSDSSTAGSDSSTADSNSSTADSNSSLVDSNLSTVGSKSPISDSISSIVSSNSDYAAETLQPSAMKTFDPDPQPSKEKFSRDEFVDELSDVLIDSVLNLRIFGIQEEENSDSESKFSYLDGDKTDPPPKRPETPSIQEDSSGSPFENFADKMIDSMLNIRIVAIEDEGKEGLDINEGEEGKATDTDVDEGRNVTDPDSNKETISDWKDTRGIADDLPSISSLKQKIKYFFAIKKKNIIKDEEEEKDISEMDKIYALNGKDIAADVADLEASKDSASNLEDWNPSTPNLEDSYLSPEENFEANGKVSFVPRRTPAAEAKAPSDKQMVTNAVNHD